MITEVLKFHSIIWCEIIYKTDAFFSFKLNSKFFLSFLAYLAIKEEIFSDSSEPENIVYHIVSHSCSTCLASVAYQTEKCHCHAFLSNFHTILFNSQSYLALWCKQHNLSLVYNASCTLHGMTLLMTIVSRFPLDFTKSLLFTNFCKWNNLYSDSSARPMVYDHVWNIYYVLASVCRKSMTLVWCQWMANSVSKWQSWPFQIFTSWGLHQQPRYRLENSHITSTMFTCSWRPFFMVILPVLFLCVLPQPIRKAPDIKCTNQRCA